MNSQNKKKQIRKKILLNVQNALSIPILENTIENILVNESVFNLEHNENQDNTILISKEEQELNNTEQQENATLIVKDTQLLLKAYDTTYDTTYENKKILEKANNTAKNTEKNTEKNKKPLDIFFGSSNEKPPSPIPLLTLKDIPSLTAKAVAAYKSHYSTTLTGKNASFSNAEIKLRIDKLSSNELSEVFKIIKNNNEKYSTNKNGIFVNISNLKQITHKELSSFLVFCEKNNKIFEEEEHTRDIYRYILLELGMPNYSFNKIE